jgi:hypothetical protein
MNRAVNSYWVFASGSFATVNPGAPGSSPLEKPLLAFPVAGTGTSPYRTLGKTTRPMYAAQNAQIVGLGGLQMGTIRSPGPLYESPGQILTAGYDSAVLA